MSWFDDDYVFKARIAPLVLAMVPLLTYGYAVTAFVGFDTSILGVAGTGIIIVTVLIFAEQIVRRTGMILEKKLFDLWGGPPTTRFLRFSDSTYGGAQKNRILQRLSKMRDELPPDQELERNSPSEFDSRVALLVGHAREITRKKDAYPRIRAELKNYGYRRNLLALRSFGLFLSLLVAITAGFITAWIFHAHEQFASWLLVSAVIGGIWSIWWFFEVNENWVKEGADHYAKALLEAIDAYSSTKAE